MDTSCNLRIRFDFKCLRAQMYECYIEHRKSSQNQKIILGVQEVYYPNPPIKPHVAWKKDRDNSEKIQMKYMPDFDGDVVIIGNEKGYRLAYEFFQNPENILLSDERAVIYHDSPLMLRESLIMTNTERLEIVEICKRFSQGDSTKYYVDMETAPEKGIMMSSKRYNDKIFL